ncbi:MAG: Zn-dependent exopeptidase M28 [Clostridiales bacterium]|jgi:hypothetical protein|nr:Zn-dependent exopeptidase M28 [Clostridiales bacterium]
MKKIAARAFGFGGAVMRAAAFLTAALAVFSAFSGFLGGGAAFAAETGLSDGQRASMTYKYMSFFASNYRDRTAGTAGCEAAAGYLSGFFDGLDDFEPYTFERDGLVDASDGAMKFAFEDYGKNTLETSNIVYVKKASKPYSLNKRVIIGAHYDNSYSLEINGAAVGGEGVVDNAGGVGVMLAIAAAIDGIELDFDVVFAAFSAEEYGLLGSSYFVESMSEREIADTLLMINLDCLTGGDYLYLYVDELKRLHGQYLFDLAEDLELDIRRVPVGRLALYEDPYSGLGYLRYTMMSDHAPFYKAGINTAYFTGANFSLTGGFTARESKTYPDIINTKDDTWEKYAEYYGDTGYIKGDAAVELIANALMRDDFAAAMLKSAATKRTYSLLYNNAFYISVYVVLTAALIGLAYIAYKKLDVKYAGGNTDAGETRKDIVVFEEFGI